MTKLNTKIFAFSILMVALFFLAACSSTASESAPIVTKGQQSDVYIPVVEKDISESDELVSGEASEAYPDLESETQNLEGDDLQEEATLLPQEEPTQVIKPTPRGNELVATNPSTVKLDSGKIQLVELFAFW